MRSSGRRGWIIGAAALLVLGAGCTGFFVNQPNSISVTTLAGASTFTVAQGSTVQLQATASYNSGSKDVTKSAVWQSSSACATVSAGTVKGVGTVSNVTITASLGGVNGSATGSVTGGTGTQTLTITSSPSGSSIHQWNHCAVLRRAQWHRCNRVHYLVFQRHLDRRLLLEYGFICEFRYGYHHGLIRGWEAAAQAVQKRLPSSDHWR